MSDELLRLMAARQEMRDAVLLAIMAPDSASGISAWTDVDKTAIRLARQRRRYDKHVREVCRKAGRPLPGGQADDGQEAG